MADLTNYNFNKNNFFNLYSDRYILQKDTLYFLDTIIDLQDTLHGGQTFNWIYLPESKAHQGIICKKAVEIAQQEKKLIIKNITSKNMTMDDVLFWAQYLALDFDYEYLKNIFSNDCTLKKCIQSKPNIRVLRQPFFETLLSFIISQTNNIPRITGIVQRLCTFFGEPINENLYTFPSPNTLASLNENDLSPIRAGFRAKYLIDAAQKIASGQICEDELKTMTTDEARKKLYTIYGVGNKVADCVLLFSLNRSEVIPMDVWMKKAMQTLFPNGLPICTKNFEGIAQQYIFEWYRKNYPKK